MFIQKFLQYIKYEKGYSAHTFISYQTDLLQFRDFVESKSIIFEPDKIDASLIREWIVTLMESGASARSVNRKLSSLKSFYRFLKQQNPAFHNPLKKIVAPKNKKQLPKFLKEDELENLLDSDDSLFENSFAGVRDKLMMEMFYTLGIRLSELIGIKDADMDMNGKTVVITGKRNKQRLLPFGDRLKDAVQEYMKIRNETVACQCGNLFVKEDGGKLYPMLVYRIVKRYITMVSSLSKRSPHVLRHTFATTMLNNGAELNAVKELLGHSNLAATEVYTHTSFEQLQKIYKQAHPRA